jgi:hypothetical protein
MKTKIFNCFFVLISAVIIFSLFSCSITPASISSQTKYNICEQVTENSYIALIEGFQPVSGERMKSLGQRLSLINELSVCATSGNHDEHMSIIRQAYKNHRTIYIAGYSTGEAEAISLTEDCEKEGIAVEILFLLDGFQKAKIHTTVKHVVDIIGSHNYMFRRSERYTYLDLENKKTSIKYFELDCNHLGIPANSYDIFSKEIALSQ